MIHLLVLCGCADTTGVGAPADFGHKPFDEILRKHVNDKGLVNYTALRAQDRPRLDAYLRPGAEDAAERQAVGCQTGRRSLCCQKRKFTSPPSVETCGS